MEHPVYPFRAVLRELRRDAGLTILAAAEATGYGKYERWESGQTKVGGQYLRSIAEAFAVTDDLHLLLYAWVLDQLTPDAGGPARRLDLDELRRTLASTAASSAAHTVRSAVCVRTTRIRYLTHPAPATSATPSSDRSPLSTRNGASCTRVLCRGPGR